MIWAFHSFGAQIFMFFFMASALFFRVGLAVCFTSILLTNQQVHIEEKVQNACFLSFYLVN